MSYTAGEGRLAIVPDATGFADKLKADMRKIRAEFALNVTANVAQARADIDRFRDSQQRNGMRLPVDVALAQATADMDRWRARQRADGLTVKVDADTGQAERKLDELRRKSFGNTGDFKTAGLFTLGAAAISPASIALVTDLAGALQQLAQSALVVPGALAGIGASVGTMVLGLSGIKDAYDAVTKASASSSQDQAAQARAAMQAHDQLRNSVVDDANAHKDLANAYRDARQELEDLNIEARGGQISEAQAINDALKARRDLMKGGFKDQLDYNDALLRVQSADQRVVEVHQRNIETQQKLTEENSKGIANNDRVVAAQERVVRSGQQVAEAQSAVDQATNKSSASATAAAQAMAKLGPNAQALVTTLTTLTPTFQAFRTAISQPLLDGVSGGIQKLVASDLPLLQTGMSRIAQAINTNIKTTFGALESGQSRGFLDRILGNTADAQNRVNAAINPFINAIGTLSAAGSNSLPHIADDIALIADKFNNFISAADKDGRLDKWINDGITGMEHLGSILLHLGESFTAITKAAGGGSGLLGTLDSLTSKLSAFLNSDQGQQQLKEFFRTAHEELAQWLPILQQLPGVLHGVLDASRDWMGAFLPLLKDAAELMGKYPGLTEAVVVAFGAWKTISGVAGLISNLEKINDLLGSGGKGKGGKGGKGILGKLGLIAIGGIALDTALNDTPDTPPQTAAAAPSAVNPGQLPAGQSVPFGSVPILPPNALAPVAAGAAGGALTAGPLGAAGGALIATPGIGDDKRPQSEKDVDVILNALPRLSDDEIRNNVAGPLGLSVDQVKSMSRDDLRNLMLSKMSGGAAPAAPIDPTHGLLTPGYAKGGPTPSGRGNGPTGGWISELHGDEWVLPSHARAAVGDQALWALTNGRHFDLGGTVDQYGNPITPGMAPGPSQPNIAPNPTAGGGGIINSIIGGVASGLGGPIGNVLSLGSGLANGLPGMASAGNAGGNVASNFAGMPGIAGLFGSLASPNPLQSSLNWTSQTANYVANWGVKTAGSLLSTLWQGGLDFFGLGNSILSPNNSWNQALQKTGQFALGQNGPLGALMGGGSPDSGSLQLGQEGIQLGDGSVISVPTFGTSGTPNSLAPSTVSSAVPSGNPGKGAESWRPLVRATLAKYGPQFGITNYQLWEDRIVKQIGTESGGNPSAINNYDSNAQAGHPSQGLLQFIPSTFASNNISGGQYLDPAAQIAAVIPYVVHRYGMDSSGGPNAIGQGHGYAAGGPTPYGSGPLPDGGYPAVVHPGEFMISARGRATVPDSFLHQLNAGQLRGFAAGGPIPQAYVPPQPGVPVPAPTAPKPDFSPGPGAQFKQLPTAITPPTAPRPQATPPPAPPIGQAAQAAPSPAAPSYTPAPNIGAAPSSLDHNLPAISTAIKSTASVLGNLASQAIGAGMAGAGLPGGGAAGQFVSGLIQEGGKIANDVVNVGSSFLVGSVPGSFGSTQDRAFGQTVMAQQNVPVTAPLRGGPSIQFNGISDVDRIMQELNLRDAQSRAQLAAHGG